MQGDATGRSFLSYRRQRKDEAALIIAMQAERGIPTWQDLRNLDDGPTEEQIRAALKDPSVSNAIVFLTPEVAKSDFIKKVEIAGIIERIENDPLFFAVIVAAGGLDYDGAAEVIKGHTGVQNIAGWNILKIDEDPIDLAPARTIANRVLRQRLAAISSCLAAEDPVKLRLWARKPLVFQLGAALSIDWSHLFGGRQAEPVVWTARLLPALNDVVSAIETAFLGRTVEASGIPTISAATALGVEFLAPRGLSINWMQFTLGRGEVPWNLNTTGESCGYTSVLSYSSVESDELAVLVSVNEDVTNAFVATQDALPQFRAVLRIKKEGNPPHDLAAPGQATNLAFLVRDEIRKARQELRLMGGLHLFMAVPVGLAMMIGQLLNTLGDVHLYEHVANDGVGHYEEEVVLTPSA